MLPLLALLACASVDCDASADADADGLDDCVEADLGTDPTLADSDGDGLTDGEESDCVSDPLDADEQCYACGWPHGDPGDLQATGPAVGDTIDNIALVDQCGEALPLWDLAGSWRLLFMTAEWCGACLDEARGLTDVAADVAASHPGLAFSPVALLFQDINGQLPDATAAARYADTIDARGFPVVADPDAAVLQATPWTGHSLPGLCLLSPDMVMVECTDGANKLDDLVALAVELAGS